MVSSTMHAASITALSFVCFSLCCAAVFIPIWGYFEDGNGSFGSDRGYFGPWKVCKELTYDRTRCGSSENVSRFRPSHFVLASGITLVVSTVLLGVHFLLSVIQTAAISSREKFLKSKVYLSSISGTRKLSYLIEFDRTFRSSQQLQR